MLIIPTFTLISRLTIIKLNPIVVTIKIYVAFPTTLLTLSSHVELIQNTFLATT